MINQCLDLVLYQHSDRFLDQYSDQHFDKCWVCLEYKGNLHNTCNNKCKSLCCFDCIEKLLVHKKEKYNIIAINNLVIKCLVCRKEATFKFILKIYEKKHGDQTLLYYCIKTYKTPLCN